MNTTDSNPTLPQEEISQRARRLWQDAGNPDGRDLEFWLTAEDELRREHDQDNPAQPQRSAASASAAARPSQSSPSASSASKNRQKSGAKFSS